jgi:hypothetical protein
VKCHHSKRSERIGCRGRYREVSRGQAAVVTVSVLVTSDLSVRRQGCLASGDAGFCGASICGWCLCYAGPVLHLFDDCLPSCLRNFRYGYQPFFFKEKNRTTSRNRPRRNSRVFIRRLSTCTGFRYTALGIKQSRKLCVQLTFFTF